MHPTKFHTALLLGALVTGGLGLTACGDDDNDSTTGTTSAGGAKTVALLLPESKTARYEARDRPLFTAALKKNCPDCKLIDRLHRGRSCGAVVGAAPRG